MPWKKSAAFICMYVRMYVRSWLLRPIKRLRVSVSNPIFYYIVFLRNPPPPSYIYPNFQPPEKSPFFNSAQTCSSLKAELVIPSSRSRFDRLGGGGGGERRGGALKSQCRLAAALSFLLFEPFTFLCKRTWVGIIRRQGSSLQAPFPPSPAPPHPLVKWLTQSFAAILLAFIPKFAMSKRKAERYEKTLLRRFKALCHHQSTRKTHAIWKFIICFAEERYGKRRTWS